jgi:hypothetical protein
MIKRQWLHEAAKFLAGLVAADFITVWWLSMQRHMPDSFMGIPLADPTASLIVDFFLFLMLVHYAWNIGKIPQIKERMYLVAAGVVFTVVAGGHLLRILYNGDVTIFGWTVPIFLSWFGVVAATYLAYSSFHLAGRLKR